MFDFSCWPAACPSSAHEPELPHFRKAESLLRPVRTMAFSPPHAGRLTWMVLFPVLPGLPAEADATAATARYSFGYDVAGRLTAVCRYLGKVSGRGTFVVGVSLLF
jgi:hypothetical protein